MEEEKQQHVMILIGLDVGLHNLSLCKIRRDSTNTIEEILGWELLDCIEGKNAKKISIEDGCSAVVETLNSMPDFFQGVDVLAIEAQPCGRVATGNLKMKCISHSIQTWTMVKFPETKVVFVNPKNKLTREFCGEVLRLEGGDAAVKARYKKHKQMAVDACISILEGFQEWKEFFHSHRKKDDIADALLLAAVAERKKARKRRKKE